MRREPTEIKELWLDQIPSSVEWEKTLFLAIEGDEEDLRKYIQAFSEVSKILDECLQRGKPILLVSPTKIPIKSILFQYGTFLKVKRKKNLQETTNQSILLLHGRKKVDCQEKTPQ